MDMILTWFQKQDLVLNMFFNHLYCLPVLQVLRSVQQSSHTLQQTHPVNVLETSDHHLWLHPARQDSQLGAHLYRF